MTVPAASIVNTYAGDGVITEWAYTFPITAASDIIVELTSPAGVIEQLSANYSVDEYNSKVIYPTEVSLLDPLPSGWIISISRAVPITQDTDLKNQGRISTESIEDALDKLTMICQQLSNGVSQTFIPIGNQDSDGSWRIVPTLTELLFQQRQGGVWVTMFTVAQ